MELTYQQVLADVYEETAKNLLVYPNEHDGEDLPPEEKFDYEPNELPDPEEFNKFHGDRNKPEHVIKPDAKDSSKSSSKNPTQIKNTVLCIDGAFRGNIVPNTTATICGTGIPAENQTTGTSSSNFVFTTSRLFKNITSVKMTSLEFPNVFYTFSEARGNTSFTLSIQSGFDPYGNPSYTTNEVTIPDGNYMDSGTNSILTATTLTLAIRNAINDAFTGITTPVAVNYNPTTHLVTFNCQKPFFVTFPSSNSNPHGNGIGYNLGFFQKQYTSKKEDPPLSGYMLQADVFPDVIQDKYIYIQINDWNLVEHQEYGQTHFPVFARIQLPLAKNNMIYDNNYTNSCTKEYFFEQPVNIQRLEIKVIDAYGNTLDMLNANISMTLELRQVNDSSVYEKLIEL